ncbi:MAG: GAF domain-containing protein, partial [Candidatus Eremiobacterota bacterium]
GEHAFLITPCMDRLHFASVDDQASMATADFLNDCVLEATGPYVICDLAQECDCSQYLDKLRRVGMRGALMLPFGGEHDVKGILSLASPRPNALDALAAFKLRSVLPLFSVALRRTMDSLHSRVQAVMKEQFTAIHPAIEWRFARAALNWVRQNDPGEAVEEIVFKEVYPLFGSSDIRSSSTIRSQSIQADLLRQLGLAGEVLASAYRERPLPYLDSLSFRVRSWTREIEPGLHSGDETRILEFLRHELEPLFARLEAFGPRVAEAAGAYRGQLDPSIGILYQRRKLFEDSVGEIREMITGTLYERQQEAQAFFPHYFEMHKTDGVDHTIYLGPSTVPEGRFDPLYLRNLRLWQLLVMVEIARKSVEIVPRLPMALETAHLLLVQDMPLSIRFHVDEKQFNVDGAYNVRYEIIKKRLDKAEVEGTGERLTQPGRVAIVYSHPREAAEYREYIDYLRDAGQISDEVEELSVGPLQGVQGLKALRIAVT